MNQITPGTDGRPVRLGAAQVGTLLGIWWGLCVAVVLVFSWAGWWLVPPDYTIARLLHAVAEKRWGWTPGIAGLVGAFAAALVLAGALLGGLVGLLARWLRIDPTLASADALTWTWKATRRHAWILLVPPLVLVWLERHDLGALGWGLLIGILPIPFFVNDRALLAGNAGQWRMRWRWPGVLALVGLFCLLLVDWASEGLLLETFRYAAASPAFHPSWLLMPVTYVACLLISCGSRAAADGLWVDGVHDAAGVRRTLRKALAREWIGAYLALDFRVGALFMAIAPLLLLPAVLAIYELPQVETQLAQSGRELPETFRVLRHLLAVDAILLLLPLTLPAVLVYRRLWVVLDRDTPT
jgi:hypothetical protein